MGMKIFFWYQSYFLFHSATTSALLISGKIAVSTLLKTYKIRLENLLREIRRTLTREQRKCEVSELFCGRKPFA